VITGRPKKNPVRGKKKLKKMYKVRREASNLIVVEKNFHRPITELDLHGLFVTEALETLKKRIKEIRDTDIQSLDVIVGRGNHSDDGKARIKPAVTKYLKSQKLQYYWKNPGFLVIILKSEEEKGFDWKLVFTSIGGLMLIGLVYYIFS